MSSAAYGTQRRDRAREVLRGLPIPCQADPSASSGPADHLTLVAVRGLGAGYLGHVSLSAWGLPLPLRRHRQVHQMGRGECRLHHPAGSAFKFIKGPVS